MQHFISYSSVDAADFALKLADCLTAGPPSLPVWVDKRNLRPDRDWDTQLREAIQGCASLLFVMSPDSVEDGAVCKAEWVTALRCKKPLVLLRLGAGVEAPFRLTLRQHIDFTDFDVGLANLRQHLSWLTTPAGQLQQLRARQADAARDLRRANSADRLRIQQEMGELKAQIKRMGVVVQDPAAAAQRTQHSIAARLESERRPLRPVSGERRSRFINPPPMVAPTWFQDRHEETRLVAEFLRDDTQRLITLVGRGGIGKTAITCRILRALESGQFPDDLGPIPVGGIVYLGQVGSHQVNVPNLFGDLCSLLPAELADRLQQVYREPHRSTHDKMLALLEAFQGPPVVVLLDNLEQLVDPETHQLLDSDLDETLRTVLSAPYHALKLVLTSRVAIRDLPLVQPQRQRQLPLDDGLVSPYAENVLRALDPQGVVGLRDASDLTLDCIRRLTRGFPRALEAVQGCLVADRSTTLDEVLARASQTLPENVVETLVGEAFCRLDGWAQQVMEALAIFARPVPPLALDWLLQPFIAAVDSAPILRRLVDWHFVRAERGRFYLHPVDLAYALGRIPVGCCADREAEPPMWTQYALRHRAAAFFAQARRPRESWKALPDLEPQLAEFDLRCAGEDFDSAARVLQEIDFHHLLLWGHCRLLVELRERLVGKLGDRWMEGANLGSLGLAWAALGQVECAIENYEQALEIAREIGDQYNHALANTYLGQAATARGDLPAALEQGAAALAIASETGHYQCLAEAHLVMATAHLLADRLHEAAQAAQEARAANFVLLLPRILALQVTVALRLGDPRVHEMITSALQITDDLLQQTPGLQVAREARALVLSGLVLCQGPDHLPAAAAAWLAARALTARSQASRQSAALGTIQGALQLFDALAPADPALLLAPCARWWSGSTKGCCSYAGMPNEAPVPA